MKKIKLPFVILIVLSVFVLDSCSAAKNGYSIPKYNYIGFFNCRSVSNPDKYYIGYITSMDKINWSKGSNRLLQPRKHMFDSMMLNGPCPVQVGENIYVYYSGYDGKNWTTGLTIFDKDLNILTRVKKPVIGLGASGSWDDTHIFRVSVEYCPDATDKNKTFTMLYGGCSNGIYKIGLAYSPDGLKWKKYENNPILTNGNIDDWDSKWASQPTVTKVDNTYYLAYNGYDGTKIQGGIASAPSLEGPWVKNNSNPILRVRPNAVQRLTSNVIKGDKFIKVSNSAVFDINEPAYLQSDNGTELVRIKSKPDINTIELYEPVVLDYSTKDNGIIESLFNKSLGPNQIEFENGTWSIYCSVWANYYGYETTAYAQGYDLNALEWIYDRTPIIEFNPENKKEYDSLSLENIRFVKIQ